MNKDNFLPWFGIMGMMTLSIVSTSIDRIITNKSIRMNTHVLEKILIIQSCKGEGTLNRINNLINCK